MELRASDSSKSFPSAIAGDYALIAMTDLSRSAVLRRVIRDLTPNVVWVRDSVEATHHVESTAPRLLITDLSLPANDGLSLLHQLRRVDSTNHAAIVVICASESMRLAAGESARALKIGKILPMNADLWAVKEAMTTAWARPAEQPTHVDQPAAREASFEVSDVAPLMSSAPPAGVANRRRGEENGGMAASGNGDRAPIGCIRVDIDRPKPLNEHAHVPAGDHLLREVSGILRRAVRAHDVVCRWGGEEFLIVLPGANATGARALAERIRAAVESAPPVGLSKIRISAGAAAFEADELAPILAVADRQRLNVLAAARNAGA